MFRLRFDFDPSTDRFFSTRALALQQIGQDILDGTWKYDDAEVDEIEVNHSVVGKGSTENTEDLVSLTARRERKDLGWLKDRDHSMWYLQADGSYRLEDLFKKWHSPDSEFYSVNRDEIIERWGVVDEGV
jgi:hypothetical protein